MKKLSISRKIGFTYPDIPKTLEIPASIGVTRGYDIDRPRNLAKSATV